MSMGDFRDRTIPIPGASCARDWKIHSNCFGKLLVDADVVMHHADLYYRNVTCTGITARSCRYYWDFNHQPYQDWKRHGNESIPMRCKYWMILRNWPNHFATGRIFVLLWVKPLKTLLNHLLLKVFWLMHMMMLLFMLLIRVEVSHFSVFIYRILYSMPSSHPSWHLQPINSIAMTLDTWMQTMS